ncbi:hypothetical protein NKJ70_21300 [Mesorhizobium sp. M0092]|uniref:hypothetical protein n=1 Tax=Mesorhizobium sp. M0092 TaxID=2956876 RepID=UPI00333A0552
MNDRKVTPDMVPVIKLARHLDIPYSWISGYYPGLNFGRIADVMAGRKFPRNPAGGRTPARFSDAGGGLNEGIQGRPTGRPFFVATAHTARWRRDPLSSRIPRLALG